MATAAAAAASSGEVAGSHERRTSRSPRGGARRGGAAGAGAGADGEDDGEGEAPFEEWNGSGPAPGERSFMGQLSQQRAYLEQILNPRPPPESVGAAGPPPKELAAGLPLEAARALLLLGPEPLGAPWPGLPAETACAAAALRLFSRLLPGREPPLDEGAAARLCGASAAGGSSSSSSSAAAAVDSLESLAASWGLESRRVPSAEESMKAMCSGRPTVCCVVLQAYVGVVEDPDSGEELEHEVGSHCLMVVGGDLLGTSHVTFDPFGLRAGEVSYWSSHSLQAAAPVAWVELSPKLE